VRDAGCAIIGQTDDLAPADRRLYSIRDVTATVESIPLITASILSKKLAAGLNGLVMDVKTGSGAFMSHMNDAKTLSQSLVTVAQAAGLPTHALITDMDQPLASSAGNALEVSHALAHLTGTRREKRMQEIVCSLGGEMLLLGKIAPNRAEGYQYIEDALTSGRAAECFARMVHRLGGPIDLLERPAAHLSRAPVNMPAPARATGFVQRMATRDIGLMIVGLGGGRRRADDQIDPSVGLTALVEVGQHVSKGEPLAYIHAARAEDASWAAGLLTEAIEIGPHPVTPTPVVLDWMTP
jgi:thymidine phosphorylase